MSKKKSYMDIANILKEDIISAFFRGLFTGKRTSKKDVDSQLKKIENKFRKDIKKDVDNINRTTANFHRIINARRKKDGKPPAKFKAGKITVDDVVKDLKNR